ncbi:MULTISPECIES: O-antigen ligase family protein [unclassified Microbacterium]|uniref:O-antigen ligase family protein n=1 Tax=Microbacterium TaxID=33882 RepID=UPI003BA22ABB
MFQLGVAVMAWIVGGAFMATELRRPDPFGFIIVAVTLFLIIQFAYVALQTTGVLSVGVLEAGGETLARVRGTFHHPGNLGKALYAMLLLTLPALISRVRRTRLLAVFSLAMILVMIGLSYSRANMVAVAATLVVWAICSPGQHAARRFLTLLILAIIALPFVDALVARFESDPEGGVRPQVWEAAMQQLSQNPLFGTGPNAFIAEVGQWNSSVALGYPVHNSFVLLAAELGVLGALAYFAPQLGAWFSAARMWFTRRATPASSAVLASAPGILAIGWTGWGLIDQPYLSLWFLAMGMLVAMMRSDRKGADEHR